MTSSHYPRLINNFPFPKDARFSVCKIFLMPEEIQSQPVDTKRINKHIISIAALVVFPCLLYLVHAAFYWLNNGGTLDFFSMFLQSGPYASFFFTIYWAVPVILNINLLRTARVQQNIKLIRISKSFFVILAMPYIVFLCAIISTFVLITWPPPQ